ncbi:MAG: GMC oxidoreductase, partial [Dehalococcoidia bacterium]|nr:GMC oxidoreductase [Dehalococcoidia bacterium]
LENDRQPGRGTDGAVSVERMWGGSLFTADFAAVVAEAGVPPVSDVSGPYAAEGSGLMTRTLRDGRRAHAALAYLDDARARANLQIIPDTLVDVIDWTDGRVTHARAIGADGEPVVIEADRFVLAAGAVGSPILLQRSGIGPEELLHHVLGPQTRVHHLPGVGRNLHDHFGAQLIVQATDDAFDRLTPPGETRPRVSFAVRLKSRPDLDAYDLDVFTSHASARPARRADEVMVFYVFLVHPEAEGYIEITGRDPHAPPIIQTGFGLDADIEAIARGIEWVRERLATPTMRQWVAAELRPGATITDAALRQWARENIHPFHHPTGTCKLGPDSDPLAVVDATGRVRGFANLYVADASIMPTIPRGMIILTVYAIAEKIAAGLAV